MLASSNVWYHYMNNFSLKGSIKLMASSEMSLIYLRGCFVSLVEQALQNKCTSPDDRFFKSVPCNAQVYIGVITWNEVKSLKPDYICSCIFYATSKDKDTSSIPIVHTSKWVYSVFVLHFSA